LRCKKIKRIRRTIKAAKLFFDVVTFCSLIQNTCCTLHYLWTWKIKITKLASQLLRKSIDSVFGAIFLQQKSPIYASTFILTDNFLRNSLLSFPTIHQSKTRKLNQGTLSLFPFSVRGWWDDCFQFVNSHQHVFYRVF
jgi:hypothetical protein